MKKRVLTLAGVAIASEIIAIIAVLTIFTRVLGIETGSITANTGSEIGNASEIREHINRGVNEENAGIYTDLYNIEADISFSGNTVYIKEAVKLNSLQSTAQISQDISQLSLSSDSFPGSNFSSGNDISLNNSFDLNSRISSVSPGFTGNTIYLYVPSANTAKTTVKNIQAFMGYEYSHPLIIGSWKFNDMMLEIQISPGDVEIPPYESLMLYIEYEIMPNKNFGTISYIGNQILLANFLITPAIYKDGRPIFIYSSSFGDPYLYEVNNYRITFNIGENYEIFAPGKMEIQRYSTNEIQQADAYAHQQRDTSEEMEGQKIIFTAMNLRDFPAVVLKKENCVSGNSSSSGTGVIPSNEIHVEKIYDTDIYFINSKAASEYVIEAFSFAVERIGPYPFEKLFIVRAPIPLKGMEYSNMVFIADSCFDSNNKEDLARVTYHEIFHQWFYGIIGTDQVNEPFMDEGIVNYLAMALKGDKLGNTYDKRFTSMGLKNYLSRDEYYRLAYIDAAIYFANIHQELGRDFYKLLQLIYNEKKFSILYFDEFLQYVENFKYQAPG